MVQYRIYNSIEGSAQLAATSTINGDLKTIDDSLSARKFAVM